MSGLPLIIEVDEPTLVRLQKAAAAAGLSVEAYAQALITAGLPMGGFAESVTPFEGPRGLAEADRRLSDYDCTGVSVPLEDVLRDVRADLEARLAAKA